MALTELLRDPLLDPFYPDFSLLYPKLIWVFHSVRDNSSLEKTIRVVELYDAFRLRVRGYLSIIILEKDNAARWKDISLDARCCNT